MRRETASRNSVTVTGFTRTVSFSRNVGRTRELVGITGEVEDLDLRVTVMKSLRQFVAPHTRHHHVNDEEVEPGLGFNQPNRLQSVSGSHNFVTAMAQGPGSEAPNRFIVIHD